MDASTFSGHTTQSASSSKAQAIMVPTIEILKKGYSSNSSTFKIFCHISRRHLQVGLIKKL